MAFVKIKQGKNILKVSKKAFENIYKSKGFKVVEEDKPTPMIDSEEEEEWDEEPYEVESETVPISEMNKKQLLEYAEQNNIDLSSAKNVNDMKRIIRAARQEN